ncbi:MAG: hypothetical protein ACXVAS_11725 [Vulcanimicrobiaceae bacterium]
MNGRMKLGLLSIIAVLLATSFAGCTSTKPSSAADPVVAQENDSVAALKQKYSGVVQGTDVNGATLRVYIDVDGMSSMDEDAEGAMKQQILAQWKSIWAKNHPGKHGTVIVELRDFQGNPVFTEKAKV